MAKEPKDKAPRIKQQAARIVNITGPVTIRGTEVMNEAGEVVAHVGVTLSGNGGKGKTRKNKEEK